MNRISYMSKNLASPELLASRVGYVDIIRIVACFLVVVAHSCDPFVAQFNNNYGDCFAGALWGSLVRCCVPLFVMVSGVLLLPLKTDMFAFYKRRLSRIIIPLIIWSLITPVLFYMYFQAGTQTVSPNIDPAQFTDSAFLTKLYTFLFNFTYDTIPLWYIYMLVGIYLFLPIIGGWLAQAKKCDIQFFLLLWLISMVLPYVQLFAPVLGYTGNYGNMMLLGGCDWNPYTTFYYFSGFMGYVVLTYYLKKYPLDWSWSKTAAVCLPLFVVGYAITAGGFLYIQKLHEDNYAMLEIFWYFSGINVFMMTLAVYLVVSKITIADRPWLRYVASLTYGIFLSHFFVVQVFYDVIHTHLAFLPASFQIPLIALCAFISTGAVVALLNSNNVTRRMVQ